MPYKDPEKRRANWFKNHEERLARQREYYRKHREKRLAAKRAAYDPEKQREKNRRYYAENREDLVEYARDYRKANPESAEKQRAKYRANRDSIRERRKELYWAGPERREKNYARVKRWLKNNPDKALTQHCKRLIMEATGLRMRDIPDEIAEAKAEQIKILRWVREQIVSGTSGSAQDRNGLDPKGAGQTSEAGDAQ